MFKHLTALMMTAVLALLLTSCTVSAEEHFGEAQGYGGTLRVAVTMDGTRISTIRVVEHHETDGVGSVAIDKLPQLMVNANTTEVDDVSGATITSTALKAAVREAMATTIAMPTASPTSLLPQDARKGMGIAVTSRVGPGVDADGNPVYSLNIVAADAIFDADGRILHLYVDQQEIASPNGSGMQIFTGWPAKRSDETAFLAEPTGWQTKRQLGASYRLNSGTWAEEMDAFQRLFTGMTTNEVTQWFSAHCSDVTGKPLTAESLDDDAAKYALLTPDLQASLADVTATATMSLRGVNGDILTAIQRAWENAQGV